MKQQKIKFRFFANTFYVVRNYKNMLHYWKININIFYNIVIGSFAVCILGMLLKIPEQLSLSNFIDDLFPLLCIFIFLYLLLFFSSYREYRKVRKVFASRPFDELLNTNYKVLESKPKLLFLSMPFIFGHENEYPVRIDYDKKNILIVFGVEITPTEEQNLKQQNLIVSELGVTKKIQSKGLLEYHQEDKLISIINDLAKLFESYKLKPAQIRTTSASRNAS